MIESGVSNMISRAKRVSHEIAAVLDYHTQHADKITPSEMVHLIKQIKALLEGNHLEFLNALLPKLPLNAVDQIASYVEAIDHFAFIASPSLPKEKIAHLMGKSGFKKDHQHFYSTVLAKELGKLVKKPLVITEIFKARAQNRKHQEIGIEIFIPNETTKRVNRWIHRDRGAHIAFRIRSEEGIDLILKILNKHHVQIPSFMHGHPMKNKQEKTSVLYCETQLENHRFRLEFCHQAEKRG